MADKTTAKYARPNTFEIDLGAIARCVEKIRELIGPDIRFFATLKSNAYGYGLLPVAKTVIASGADALSLVSLDDAISLRRAGVQAPILVYAGTVPAKSIVRAFEKHNLIPTLHSDESLACFARYATRELDVAVKIDVGQERIGVPVEEAVAFIKKIAQHPKLRMHVVNTHPGVPTKGRVTDCLEWQYRRFVDMCEELERAGVSVPFKVVASSKILRMTGQSMMLNAVDPGAALFSSFAPGDPDERYQPLRSLKTRLIQARKVSRTEFLDEAAFAITSNMRIGIVPIGYSDGVHRLHCGEVLVGGERVPILGSPSLEYTRIDLTRVPAASVGDEVVIIGRQKGDRISPEEVMRKQAAARVSDLALEVKPTIARVYVGNADEAVASKQQPEESRASALEVS